MRGIICRLLRELCRSQISAPRHLDSDCPLFAWTHARINFCKDAILTLSRIFLWNLKALRVAWGVHSIRTTCYRAGGACLLHCCKLDGLTHPSCSPFCPETPWSSGSTETLSIRFFLHPLPSCPKFIGVFLACRSCDKIVLQERLQLLLRHR